MRKFSLRVALSEAKLLPVPWMGCRLPPAFCQVPKQFAATHSILYTFLSKNKPKWPRPKFEPAPLDPENSVLTIRLPRRTRAV